MKNILAAAVLLATAAGAHAYEDTRPFATQEQFEAILAEEMESTLRMQCKQAGLVSKINLIEGDKKLDGLKREVRLFEDQYQLVLEGKRTVVRLYGNSNAFERAALCAHANRDK